MVWDYTADLYIQLPQESKIMESAVIETGDKQPSFFQIGDLISEDIVLAAIEGQAAIIERDGNLRLILVLWGGKS